MRVFADHLVGEQQEPTHSHFASPQPRAAFAAVRASHALRGQGCVGEQDQAAAARHSRARADAVHAELLHHRHRLRAHGGPRVLVATLYEDGLLSGRQRVRPGDVRLGQRGEHVPRAPGNDRHHHDRHVWSREGASLRALGLGGAPGSVSAPLDTLRACAPSALRDACPASALRAAAGHERRALPCVPSVLPARRAAPRLPRPRIP